LTEFKNCHRQRQRSRWLAGHWHWLSRLWGQLTGQKVSFVAPSQSTLSRVMNQVDFWALKQQFFIQILSYREQARGANLVTHLKHYSFDGKSRKGITSDSTGRTEIDLVIFDVEKTKVIATHHLADKEGESTKATNILKQLSRKIEPGIFTGDAGFLSPDLMSTIVSTGHEYLIGLKANAGEAFEVCKNLEWAKAPVIAESHNHAHGREETRKLQRLFILSKLKRFFCKYSNSLYIYRLESTRIIKGKSTTEERFLIGSKGLKGVSQEKALGIIRAHWLQENRLHWVKDKVLGEDGLAKMENRSSRLLGFLKDIVVAIGYNIYQSVQKFVDVFDADPERMTGKLLNLN